MNIRGEGMSLSDRFWIDVATRDFRMGLRVSLPILPFGQFYDYKEIYEAVEQEKEYVLRKFDEEKLSKNPDRISYLLEQLSIELKAVADEFVAENEQHCLRAISVLEKEMDLECDKFQVYLEAKLKTCPKLDLKSVTEWHESGKLSRAQHFNQLWERQNLVVSATQKSKLMEKLNCRGVKVTRRLIVENGQAEKFFEEMKTTVLEMSWNIKSYINTLQNQTYASLRNAMKRANKIHHYVIMSGSVLPDMHEKIRSGLLVATKVAIFELHGHIKTFVKYVKKRNPSEEFDVLRSWAERFDTQLKFLCFGKREDIIMSTEKIEDPCLESNEVVEASKSSKPNSTVVLEIHRKDKDEGAGAEIEICTVSNDDIAMETDVKLDKQASISIATLDASNATKQLIPEKAGIALKTGVFDDDSNGISALNVNVARAPPQKKQKTEKEEDSVKG